MAVMPMPKTAVNERGRPVFRENYVRSAGQASHVQPVAEASREQAAADIEFGSSILRPDASHHAAPGLAVYDVGQGYIQGLYTETFPASRSSVLSPGITASPHALRIPPLASSAAPIVAPPSGSRVNVPLGFSAAALMSVLIRIRPQKDPAGRYRPQHGP